jgi:hypothetical protein
LDMYGSAQSGRAHNKGRPGAPRLTGVERSNRGLMRRA